MKSYAFLGGEFMGHFLKNQRDDRVRGRYDEAIQTGFWDVYYEDAAYLAYTYKYVSTALLQRKLDIGFNRAQKLADTLAESGVVESKPTTGARDVAMSWRQLRKHLKFIRDMRSRMLFNVIGPVLGKANESKDSEEFRAAA